MDAETVQFIRGHLDSRVKLDVALFLHRNRYTLDGPAGLALRVGCAAEHLAAALREMAGTGLVRVHGDPGDGGACLYGYSDDGLVAKLLQRVAEAYDGPERSAVLGHVLDAQSRRHHLRVAELRHLDSLKTQFLSMISHELRSPLTAIKGYAELLQINPGLDPPQRDLFLNTVVAQCDRLNTTVNNIILAAEMQQGEGWQGENRPMSLRDLVARLVEEIAAAEPRRRFEVDAPAPVPPVSADGTGAELVVRNLLDNAVKFSLDYSTIRVWFEVAGAEVLFHIGDEGVGISPDRLRAIFERFYQAEYYRTRRAGGSGLGLYLVKEIMEGMGGRIAVRSELGRGSVFTCAFRIAPEATGEPGAGPAGAHALRMLLGDTP